MKVSAIAMALVLCGAAACSAGSGRPAGGGAAAGGGPASAATPSAPAGSPRSQSGQVGGADGGVNGGVNGGASVRAGVPGAETLTAAELAGATDPVVCGDLSQVAEDNAQNVEGAGFDTAKTIEAYKAAADRVGALVTETAGPVRVLAGVAVLDLRIAGFQAEQSQSVPLYMPDDLRFLANACKHGASNGAVHGDAQKACAVVEKTLADTDGRLAGEVADDAAFKRDATGGATALGALKDAADQSDTSGSLTSIVSVDVDVYNGLAPDDVTSAYQLADQAVSVAQVCGGADVSGG